MSKKTAQSKQPAPPREMGYRQPFLKDWLSLCRSGRHDMLRLKQVMLQLIAYDAPLGAEWRDHPLKGPWADCRECHVGGDFLLIYQANENSINFLRVGSHAELFG